MASTEYNQWNAAAFEDLVNDLQKTYQGVDEELADLEKTVETHLEQWDGEARKAYTDAKHSWDQQTKELNDILTSVMSTVQDIHQSNQGAEKHGQGLFA